MRKLQQRGSVEIIVGFIFLVLVVAGAALWFGLQENGPAVTPSRGDSTVQVGVGDIITQADLEKLDSYELPESYLDYMRSRLPESTKNQSSCVDAYSIRKANSVNIVGGVDSVSHKYQITDVVCAGGAAVYWYLQDGMWNMIETQDSLECSELANTTLTAEFVESCYDEDGELADNPNE